MAVTVTSPYWLSRLITGIFTILITALSALFWITLFAPGNEWTHWIFDLIAPVTAILQMVYDFVGYPVQWVCQWIASFLPEPLTAYFPATTVKTIVTGILNLLGFIPGFTHNPITQSIYNFNYDYWFPGVIDWQIPLTVRFLCFIEGLLSFRPASRRSEIQTMINQNQNQFLNNWEQEQPFTPDTLQSRHVSNPIAANQNIHADYMSFDNTASQPMVQRPIAPLKAPPLPLPSAQQPAEDPTTGLMNRQAFQVLLNTQFNWAQKQKRPLGVVWLEIATLSVAPAQTLQQLGRWLSNLAPKEGRLIPVRYGEHSIVVLLVNQTESQAKLVAQHLHQRLSEFQFAPLVGFSHYSNLANTSPTVLIEEAYQQAVHSVGERKALSQPIN